MKVALCTDSLTGPINGTRVMLERLLVALHQEYPDDIRFTLVLPEKKVFDGEAIGLPGDSYKVEHFRGGKWPQRLNWLLGRHSITPEIGPHDIYLSGWHWPLGRRDRPFVAIIHDLEPLEHGNRGGGRGIGRIMRLWLLRRSVAAAAARAAVLVAPSQYTIDRFHALGFSTTAPVRVIAHGVDVDFWSSQSPAATMAEECRSLGLDSSQPYLLSLGQHVSRKNFARLIDAFAASSAAKSGGALVIVGRENSETQALHHRIARHGLEKQVILAGARPIESLRALLQNARVFAYPSLGEGFGLPILEAFAAGTPVITSCTTSLGEVAGADAILVQPDDATAITMAIDQLWEDASLREHFAKAGRARATVSGWPEAARLYMGLFRMICDPRPLSSDFGSVRAQSPGGPESVS